MRNTIRILCASLIALFASASLLAADNRPTGLAGLGVYGSLGRSAGDLGGGIGKGSPVKQEIENDVGVDQDPHECFSRRCFL